MIRIFAVTKDLKALKPASLEELSHPQIDWYWVDFSNPDEKETALLDVFFHFHLLAIEDCLYALNRPKLDHYEQYVFLILNALNQDTLEPEEVALFVSDNYIVSFHKNHLPDIDEAWSRVVQTEKNWDTGPSYVAHQIMDKIVDQFFPVVNRIEDYLTEFDDASAKKSIRQMIDEVFKIRGELLKLRRLVNSMRDLLYRLINSERLEGFQKHKIYFADIYDHLLKLSEMIESSREITSEMRDSYLSVNTNRMNTHMMVLTVITTIFIPLTFLAGIYGMNFKYMPELNWSYGYFICLLVMAGIGISMYLWFKHKGWFDI